MGIARTTRTLAAAAAVASLAALAARAGDEKAPRFPEVTAGSALEAVAPYRLVVYDVDRDGRPDVVVQDRDGHPENVALEKDATGKEIARPVNPGGTARWFRNVAPGPGGVPRFEEQMGALDGLTGGTRAAGARNTAVFTLFADVNGDGRTDLFRACYQEQAVHKLWPDTGERSAIALGGEKGFARVADSGVDLDGPVTTCAAAFLDYDRDGHLDLFTGNWYRQFGVNKLSHVSRLWRGDGAGHFTDVTETAGLLTTPDVAKPRSCRPVYGVSHTDLDGDGLQDLIVAAYGREWNRLWRNKGDGTFEDIAPTIGFDGDDDRSGVYPPWIREEPLFKDRKDEAEWRSNGNSFSAIAADFDDDGDMDLFCTAITHGWAGPSADLTALLVNEGLSTKFRRVSDPFLRPHVRELYGKERKHWNQGDYLALFADFDLDGRLDVLVASTSYPDPQRLWIWRQKEDHGFEETSAAWGIDYRDPGGVGVADVDGDGSLDIVVAGYANQWNKRKGNETRVWLNRVDPGRKWIAFTLEGTFGTNRDAIGARVRATAGGVTRTREVVSSLGHFGSLPPREVHFGLGAADAVDVEVTWPDEAGTKQTFRGVRAGKRYRIRQGDAAPSEMRITPQ